MPPAVVAVTTAHGDGDGGVVVLRAGKELHVDGVRIPGPRWQDDGSEHLPRLEAGLEQVDEQLVEWDIAVAIRAGGASDRVEGDQHGRGILRGIGVRQAAADRRLVSDPDRGHLAQRLGKGWCVPGHLRRALERADRLGGAEDQGPVVRSVKPAQLRDPSQAHQHRGLEQPLAKHQDDRGAAGDQVRVVAVPREESDRLIHARGLEVVVRAHPAGSLSGGRAPAVARTDFRMPA